MSKKRRGLSPEDLAKLAELHAYRRPQVHQVVVGATTFHAVSAHDLLDMDNLTRNTRPGVPH